jgi:hypothetical protein
MAPLLLTLACLVIASASLIYFASVGLVFAGIVLAIGYNFAAALLAVIIYLQLKEGS